jgi:hypothetical protein
MTHDPQQPSPEEPPEQGGRGNTEPQRGRRNPPPRQGRGDQQNQGGSQQQPGTQRGEYQQAGGQGGAHQENQQGAYRASQPQHGSHAIGEEPKAHKSHTGLFVALGIVGLLALGGLIGGLVAAFGGSSYSSAAHHVPSVPTHAPASYRTAPSPAASGHLIKMFQYIGPRSSGGFTVPTSAVASHYIYRCPTGPGPFDAKMTNASGSDTQTIATTSGPGGTGSTVLHPKFPGKVYHLNVSTKCEYRIQVYAK